jgi:hypothetical protein
VGTVTDGRDCGSEHCGLRLVDSLAGSLLPRLSRGDRARVVRVGRPRSIVIRADYPDFPAETVRVFVSLGEVDVRYASSFS